MKKLVIDEKGAALILALILLLIGGLISAALLGHMGAGILAGQVHERRTAELYAADAGVEDAIWRLPDLGLCPHQSTNYTISDVNGKRVEVFIENTGEGTYKITSIAITDDGSGTAAILSGTQVEAYVVGASAGGNYSGLLDNVITSQDEIDTKNADVNPPSGEHGPVPYYQGSWPTPEELADWYWPDVEDEDPYEFDTIDLGGGDREEGPLYRDGTLTIKNSNQTAANLTLTGTLYITGDTLIAYGTPQNRDMTLDLNGQTIFVESSTADALKIGDMCTLIGPGVIIAVGDIYFKPKSQAGGEENPIFILSVSGTIQVQPQGDFCGAIAGNITVDLQPNTGLTYPEEEGWYEGLNFPTGTGIPELIYSIASWEISQL